MTKKKRVRRNGRTIVVKASEVLLSDTVLGDAIDAASSSDSSSSSSDSSSSSGD